MFNEILDLVIVSAENAFIQVTVFVGAVLLFFGYIDYLLAGKLIKKIEAAKKWQPIIGAFLGITPGCGGAIFVMPLFHRGTVTFGTITATLVATMGDAAFVLLSTKPVDFAIVTALSFIIAIITGYIIDYFQIGAGLLEDYHARQQKKEERRMAHHQQDHSHLRREAAVADESIIHLGHQEGDEIDLILHHEIKGHQPTHGLGYKLTHQGFGVYWVVLGIGLILGILDLFQIDLDSFLFPNFATIVGVSGTVLSIIMMIASKKFIQDDTHEEAELKLHNIKETIVHNAQETAFVATWVFFAYLAYELFVLALGSGNYLAGEMTMTAFLTQTGFAAVIIGTLIGMIPGCGPQIIFVSLYIRGLVPFSALLANTISQDGDALFPLIAIDKKASVWVTIINTIVAFIVGIISYWLQFSVFG